MILDSRMFMVVTIDGRECSPIVAKERSCVADHLVSCLDAVVDQFSYAETLLHNAQRSQDSSVLGTAAIAYWRAVHHHALFQNKLWLFKMMSFHDSSIVSVESQAREVMPSMVSNLSDLRNALLYDGEGIELRVRDMIRPFDFSSVLERESHKPSLIGAGEIFPEEYGVRERLLSTLLIGWKHGVGKTKQDTAYAIEATNIASRRILPTREGLTGQIPWVKPVESHIPGFDSMAFSSDWPTVPLDESHSVDQRLMARAIIACYRASHHVKATMYEGHWLSTKTLSPDSLFFESGNAQLSCCYQKLGRISKILAGSMPDNGRIDGRESLRNFTIPLTYFFED